MSNPVWSNFVARSVKVRARKLEKNEPIKCYNGMRLGLEGDFVVLDEQDRVMIMKPAKFILKYSEEPSGEYRKKAASPKCS